MTCYGGTEKEIIDSNHLVVMFVEKYLFDNVIIISYLTYTYAFLIIWITNFLEKYSPLSHTHNILKYATGYDRMVLLR
jgi:hypothetical protein